MLVKRWIASALVVCVLLLVAMVAVAASDPVCTTITPAPAYSSINIRSSPTMADNISGRLLRGQVANVISLADGWYELSFGGYVSASVVSCAAPSPTPTRIVTNTPVPMPALRFTRLWLDVDASGDYETVIDCLQPCRIKLEQAP